MRPPSKSRRRTLRSPWGPAPVSGTILASSERNTSSKPRQNSASRSRRRNRKGRPVRPVPAGGCGPAGRPRRHRVAGHAGQVDPPGVQLDEEQHIQTPQPDGVDGERNHRRRSRRLAGAGTPATMERSAVGRGRTHGCGGSCGSRWPRPGRQAEAARLECAGSPSVSSLWPVIRGMSQYPIHTARTHRPATSLSFCTPRAAPSQRLRPTPP
jgi:hypothetical protein